LGYFVAERMAFQLSASYIDAYGNAHAGHYGVFHTNAYIDSCGDTESHAHSHFAGDFNPDGDTHTNVYPDGNIGGDRDPV
jgi:hypothetical protein